jgi:hypothetical protein
MLTGTKKPWAERTLSRPRPDQSEGWTYNRKMGALIPRMMLRSPTLLLMSRAKYLMNRRPSLSRVYAFPHWLLL